jgi:hypothetical protein
MILLETTQSRHVFRSLSAILAIGGDDTMASRAAHLGLGNISGSLAMLAAIRRASSRNAVQTAAENARFPRWDEDSYV